MKEQILESLFDSPVKFKLLRFFIRNQDGYFQISEIAKKNKVNSRALSLHIERIRQLGFLNYKIKNRKKHYFLNKKFIFFEELKKLIFKSGAIEPQKFLKMINKLGKILLAVVAGIFINEENSRVDLLLVGNIKPRKLKSFMEKLEAEIGADIKYSVLTKKEFDYRYDMYDKFIRDILDYRHEKLINKLKI